MSSGQLKAELVNPFLRSTLDIITTMLGGTLERGEPGISDGSKKDGHLMAIIGFTGKIKGTAALSMPGPTASQMVGRLLSMEVGEDDDTLIDGLSEIVNMVGGSAKADLSTVTGETLQLSLPMVISGNSYDISSQEKARWLDIPFVSDMGDFALRICFEKI